MTVAVDFSGPFLKTERANHHINELERIFRAYVIANKKALRPNRYRQMRERGGALGVHFPRHTPTVLGDAIHNLRAALDHAYCILVEANGHTIHERSFFPITSKGRWEDRKGSVEGHEKTGNGPGPKIIKVIFDEIQPYPGGKGDDLVLLHLLDIADKHLVLLPTQQRTRIDEVRWEGGGGIRNLTLITSGIAPITFGPGVAPKHDHDHKATFEICFAQGQPFESKPILPVLRELSGRVNDTLQLLERRATERP